jgi:hypothetical protein
MPPFFSIVANAVAASVNANPATLMIAREALDRIRADRQTAWPHFRRA